MREAFVDVTKHKAKVVSNAKAKPRITERAGVHGRINGNVKHTMKRAIKHK